MDKRVRLVYLGPLGRIFCEGPSFFAFQDGSPVGTACQSFDEAIEILARNGRAKVQQAPLLKAHRPPMLDNDPHRRNECPKKF